MRSAVCILALAAAAAAVAAVCVSAQAPNPPPIWPVSFQAKFGLDIAGQNPPIVNSTCEFYYNLNDDVQGQLIVYPDFCPLSPVSGNAGLDSACSALFLPAGIYLTQPSEGIECCQLFANVGPTPRNFTRGFTWQGTQVAADYHGQLHTCDHYTGGDPTALFEYWTEQITHHDVRFIDGGGPVWAWDRLDVTTVDPAMFALFSNAQTCAMPCGSAMGMDNEAVQAHAIKHDAFIKIAMHHQRLANKEAARIAAE